MIDELRRRGLVAGEDGSAALTPAGRELTDRVVLARREELDASLADDRAGRTPEVHALLQRLARELAGSVRRIPAVAVSPTDSNAAAQRGAVEVTGIARLGKRTKQLVKRLRPGDVAMIDHHDLDRVSAEDLVACGVAAC